MKKVTLFWLVALVFLASAPVFAATTVTVDDNNNVQVTPGSNVVVAQPVQTYPVVMQTVVETDPAVEDRYEVAGEIVAIDYPSNEITVRDAKPNDRRITGDPGIVATLKVGDRVKVDLRRNSNEAHRIIEY